MKTTLTSHPASFTFKGSCRSSRWRLRLQGSILGRVRRLGESSSVRLPSWSSFRRVAEDSSSRLSLRLFALSNFTGFLTSTFVFAQYLWAIAMASATFLLLRHPLSSATTWLSRHWPYAWLLFYTLAFGQAGLWWSQSQYELAGGCESRRGADLSPPPATLKLTKSLLCPSLVCYYVSQAVLCSSLQSAADPRAPHAYRESRMSWRATRYSSSREDASS